MVVRSRIPIVLLTGFLGSGKTSLLARWLRAPDFAGAMVIVNELGEVGLDHRLMATATDAPLLLENGCACCTASEDLIGTLERLFFDRLQRRIPPFSWMLIETTGIADPAPIIDALRENEITATRYELLGVVTTFDARNGRAQLTRFAEGLQQLKASDLVVITKADAATAAGIEAAKQATREVQTHAPILVSARSDLPASALLEAIRGPRHHDAHSHARHGQACASGHGAAGAHRHVVHTEAISSAFLPLPHVVSREVLDAAIAMLIDQHAPSLLRLKGVIDFGSLTGPAIVQIAQGDPCAEVTPLDPGGAQPALGLTIIAHDTPAERLAAVLAARLETAAIPGR
jgi:G3E family GTPase